MYTCRCHGVKYCRLCSTIAVVLLSLFQITDCQCFKSRPTLVSLSNSDQWGGDLPLPSGPSLSEHVGNPLWDELRSRVQTAGEALDQLPRQPTLVWDCFLPQYEEFQTAALTAVFPQWCLHGLHNTLIILLLWNAYAVFVGLILWDTLYIASVAGLTHWANCLCGDVPSEMRCHVLHLIPHGRYTCTHGFEVDSRCDFTCDTGYRIEGEHSRTCQHRGAWSGAQPVCTGTYPGLSPCCWRFSCVFLHRCNRCNIFLLPNPN